MTVYRDPHIRAIVLRTLGEVVGGHSERYAQVVGILSALLGDDREMVDAIDAACHWKKEEGE